MTRNFKIILFCIVAGVAVGAALYLGRPVIKEEKREKAITATNNLTFEQRLLVMEQEMNKSAPKAVDAATRFDGAKAAGRSFTYFYTLVNTSAPDPEMRQTLQTTEHERLKTKVLTGTEFDELRQASATIIFNYKDRLGAPYVTVKITPEDYGGNKKPEKVNPHFE